MGKGLLVGLLPSLHVKHLLYRNFIDVTRLEATHGRGDERYNREP